MRFVLVGNEDERRKAFLCAAASLGMEIVPCTWDAYPENFLPGDCVKLDPPLFEESDFDCFQGFIESCLKSLSLFSSFPGIQYLNTPQALAACLDKRETRKRLVNAGVPVPLGIPEKMENHGALVSAMHEFRMPRVFVKPRFGSGASGVMAYARSAHGKEVLYTSLRYKNGSFHNTNRIIKSEDPIYNRILLEKVLSLDAVVERWVPKDKACGVFYDLRVVCFGKEILYLVPRGSRGPITNLHLNDLALDIADIPAMPRISEKLCGICEKTMAKFPGLRCAGLDILVSPADEEGEYKLLVIEINGYGDLIYKDIHNDNRIYGRQLQYLMECGEGLRNGG